MALFTGCSGVPVLEDVYGSETPRLILDETPTEPIGVAIDLNLSSKLFTWRWPLSQLSNTFDSLLVEDNQSGRMIDKSVVFVVEKERFLKRGKQRLQDSCQPFGFQMQERQPGNNNYGNQQKLRQQSRIS